MSNLSSPSISQPCAIALCNRSARALCHCCRQNVCVAHLNEHNDVLNRQLHPFVDTTQTLSDRIQMIDVSKIVDGYRQKLEQWRAESHQQIDQFFERKDGELQRLLIEKLDEERDEINQLRNRVFRLIHGQQANHADIYELRSITDYLERELINIQESFVEIHTQPLVLDNQLITIRGINEQFYDLSILSPTYRSIRRPEGSYEMLASNERVLVIHQKPYLCFVNLDSAIFKQIPWRYDRIYDMCWSAALGCFVFTAAKSIFLLNENIMSIDKVKRLEKRKWFSCACCDKFLYLCTSEWGSSLTKISLNAAKELDKQWQSNVCHTDECIDILRYHKGQLALLIKNSTNSTLRIELRSEETLNRTWSLTLDVKWNPNGRFYCCPFLDDDWLVSDCESGRLLHVAKAGRVNSAMAYNTIPYAMTLFGTHILAVSTEGGVSLHHLNYRKTFTLFVL